MKTLSIKQPWATLIAKGYKDIENRTWDTKYRGIVLLHAGADKTNWNTIYDSFGRSFNTVCNELLFGNLAHQKDETYSAIVGYATLEDIVEDATSIWAQADSKHWIFKDAYLFDEPIRKVRGKLGLWDYPEITEDNLPKAHKFEREFIPRAQNKTLYIPIADKLYQEILNDGKIRLEMTDEIEELLLDKEGNFKEFTKIVLSTPTSSQTLNIKELGLGYIMEEEDVPLAYQEETGEIVIYKCILVFFDKD